MKTTLKILSVLLFSLISIQHINAQKWMESPFFNPAPEHTQDKAYNFHDIQKAFQEFEKEYWLHETERCEGEDKPKFKGYNGFKRWEWFNEPRVYPTGEFPRLEHLLQEYEQFSARENESAAEKTATANWVNLNTPTAPVMQLSGMGRINCLAFHPGNTSILYAGAACGGVWKSINAGQSWNVLNTDQLPSLSITSIVIDPTNPNNIYLATGDNFTGFIISGVLKQGHYSAGIAKSTDAGQTWSMVGLPSIQAAKFIPQDLIMDPITPNVLLMAANTGIWRSADGGVNWAMVQANFFYSIAFNPLNHNVVYASDARGLYRSNDNGLTWAYMTGGYPNSSQAGRVSLGVTPADTNYIYLWGPTAGFKRSTNGGISFTTTTNPDPVAQPYGYYDRAIGVSLTNPLELFVGGVTTAKSTNGGSTWASSSDFLNPLLDNYIHPDIKRIYFEPGGSKVYMTNDAGVSVSLDGGATWLDINNGLQIAEVYKIANHPFSPDTLMYGAQDNGTIRRDAQTGGMLVVGNGDGFQPLYHPTNPQIIYTNMQNGQIRKSMDGGATSVSASPGQMLWNPPHLMNPLNPNTLYAGCVGGVKRSHAAGLQGSYVHLTSGILDQIRSMGITKADTQRIYAANLATMMVTTNGGTNWTNITAGLPTNLAPITFIAVSSTNADRVYACLSGYSSGNKVFMSTNAGTTWTNYSGSNLPNVPVNCITYVDGSNDAVYIGTDFGVFFRDGAAADWTSFNSGLPNVVVNHLDVFYPAMKLRAATYGRGVWETDMLSSLPVGLQSFTAECNNSNVEVTWQTTSELGSDYFIVERSADGAKFQGIGNVKAAGTSSETRNYAFVDASPIYGTANYRLKQVDLDGEHKYSPAQTAGCNDPLEVLVYPNPNDGSFSIRVEEPLARLEIRSLMGDLVYQTVLNTTETRIDLGHQAKGVYIYQLVSPFGARQSGKIVVR